MRLADSVLALGATGSLNKLWLRCSRSNKLASIIIHNTKAKISYRKLCMAKAEAATRNAGSLRRTSVVQVFWIQVQSTSTLPGRKLCSIFGTLNLQAAAGGRASIACAFPHFPNSTSPLTKRQRALKLCQENQSSKCEKARGERHKASSPTRRPPLQ